MSCGCSGAVVAGLSSVVRKVVRCCPDILVVALGLLLFDCPQLSARLSVVARIVLWLFGSVVARIVLSCPQGCPIRFGPRLSPSCRKPNLDECPLGFGAVARIAL